MPKEPFGLGDEPPVPAARGTKGIAELEIDGFGTFSIDHIATIGRAPESHIILNIRSVSRHHSRIFFEGGHFWIKDLDSGNGTSVNGVGDLQAAFLLRPSSWRKRDLLC